MISYSSHGNRYDTIVRRYGEVDPRAGHGDSCRYVLDDSGVHFQDSHADIHRIIGWGNDGIDSSGNCNKCAHGMEAPQSREKDGKWGCTSLRNIE